MAMQITKQNMYMLPSLMIVLISLTMAVWNIFRWFDLDCGKEPLGKCKPPSSIDDHNDYMNSMFGLSWAVVLMIILAVALKRK